ncbi:MAG: LuxR C-terminal-related transcriptional regulator [Pseudomonadota bacterium]
MTFAASSTVVKAEGDIRRAAEALRDIAWELGRFRVATCSNIASKTPMTDQDGRVLATDVFGWEETPDAWWNRPLMALSSPIVRACRYESEAFWVDDKAIYPRQSNAWLHDIDLSEVEAFKNSGTLICVPVHLPFGQIGSVSFSPQGEKPQDFAKLFEEVSYTLEDASRRFLAGYVKVREHRAWIPSDCKLSKREIECLKWVAIGKTDKEIGLLLSRSSATVRFHLKHACRKLNAVSRSQAVFKASQLGFLGTAAVGR